MTSGTTDDRARWWGPVPWSAALALGSGAGAVVFFVTHSALRLYLVNVHGPYAHSPDQAALISVLLAALVASCVTLALVVAGRLTWLLLVLALAAIVACSGLYPDQIDQHESWVEEPNSRWSCRGLVFDHYPPDQTDSTKTIYCVGLETRIADG